GSKGRSAESRWRPNSARVAAADGARRTTRSLGSTTVRRRTRRGTPSTYGTNVPSLRVQGMAYCRRASAPGPLVVAARREAVVGGAVDRDLLARRTSDRAGRGAIESSPRYRYAASPSSE